ncbi:MAG: GNAT family N-acetyltransferase [Planctomycetes bacterium]|nr:GNAT family N-acetyltransferase [Planctomycetota bacterium]
MKLRPLERDTPAGLGEDYSIRLGKGEIARIKLERLNDHDAWIDWVFVPPSHRGEGLAGRLMNAVLADADQEGVNVSLEPRACAGLAQAKLEAWYHAFGFRDSGRRGDFGPIFVRHAAVAAQRLAA